MKPEHVYPGKLDQLTLTRLLQKWNKVLRGNVSYGNLTVVDTSRNIDGYPASVNVAATIGNDVPVPHGLGRIPVGFHVMVQNYPNTIYKGVTPWTASTIYIRGSMSQFDCTLFIF